MIKERNDIGNLYFYNFCSTIHRFLLHKHNIELTPRNIVYFANRYLEYFQVSLDLLNQKHIDFLCNGTRLIKFLSHLKCNFFERPSILYNNNKEHNEQIDIRDSNCLLSIYNYTLLNNLNYAQKLCGVVERRIIILSSFNISFVYLVKAEKEIV